MEERTQRATNIQACYGICNEEMFEIFNAQERFFYFSFSSSFSFSGGDGVGRFNSPG